MVTRSESTLASEQGTPVKFRDGPAAVNCLRMRELNASQSKLFH
ncbi:hypothetical protein RMSM_02606 [Rhodopirellula maiorica SM1]|uniref:Uncharacterized protein n=1 Tax=Rhodopirellula maiorica SM1 TaxID=1265738 RepID=M5S2P4_9BACT|nr:hypothetical protein RMSM_02606 [Rhodopirellula maiorica SM1]